MLRLLLTTIASWFNIASVGLSEYIMGPIIVALLL